jgi:hypothetical protein
MISKIILIVYLKKTAGKSFLKKPANNMKLKYDITA